MQINQNQSFSKSETIMCLIHIIGTKNINKINGDKYAHNNPTEKSNNNGMKIKVIIVNLTSPLENDSSFHLESLKIVLQVLFLKYIWIGIRVYCLLIFITILKNIYKNRNAIVQNKKYANSSIIYPTQEYYMILTQI